MNNRRTIFLAGVVLILATLAVYRNSLEVPFLFDDTLAIAANPSIRQLATSLNPPVDGSGASGRPLMNFSLAVNYALGGVEVRGYHAMNLALHVLAALTLWGVLRRTLRLCSGQALGIVGRGRRTPPTTDERRDPAIPPYTQDAEPAAFVIALLWAVHPLLTESVVCVVQRNEVIGGLFYLLTLYCFIRAVDAAEHSCSGALRAPGLAQTAVIDRRYSISEHTWLGLSVVSCLLGMAGKEIVATAPLLVFLYDRTFVAGTFREAWRRRGRFYGALAATWLLLAWLVWQNRQRGGTVGFGLGMSPWDYLLTQCRALVLYLQLSFWPHPLVVDYGAGVVRRIADVWWQGLLILALLAGTVVALRRRPAVGFCAAAFFVILAPSSSFVPLTTQTIAEHRMYLPLAAVLALVVTGLHRLAGSRVLHACLALAAAAGVVTVNRNEAYRDQLALWRGAVYAAPGNARAWSGLGDAHYRRGEMEKAEQHYRRSLQVHPGSPYTHYNLGLVLDRLGHPQDAARQYAEAVRILPAFPVAHGELGAVLVKLGRSQEALDHLRIALDGAPGLPESHSSYGMALAASGRPAEAVTAYEAALKLDPGQADTHFNLALALQSLGRAGEAEKHYTEAARLDARHAEARLNLSIMLAQAGRNDEALRRLQEAVSLRPSLPEARCNLGIMLAQLGRLEPAVRQYEEAVRLKPDYAVAHHNLARALAQLSRWPEAKRHAAEAVRLAPGFGPARELLERLETVP